MPFDPANLRERVINFLSVSFPPSLQALLPVCLFPLPDFPLSQRFSPLFFLAGKILELLRHTQLSHHCLHAAEE